MKKKAKKGRIELPQSVVIYNQNGAALEPLFQNKNESSRKNRGLDRGL